MPALIDRTGQRFGRLVVCRRAEMGKKRLSALWWCDCDCGSLTVVFSHSLSSGHSRSCGCLRRETSSKLLSGHSYRLRHGCRRNGKATPEYRAWCNMQARCYNPKHDSFKNYGGRGITVSDRWRNDFAVFLDDMPPHPGKGYSLDRIDNDGNYERSNCRWATRKQQTNNRRRAPLPLDSFMR